MQILYQDESLIAVNKPTGLLVHRSMIDRHETRFALQIVRDMIGQRVYPVHRLDKPTSGVLLFALNPGTARLLTEHFTDKQIEKSYLAVVRGYTGEGDTIDYPLKEQLDKISDALANADKNAQDAVTRYQRLGTVELPHAVGRYPSCRYSLVRLWPLTGRKHQLRRHMKHIFHPIIGDTSHGDGKHNQFFRDHFRCHRLLLSATDLSFPHPHTQMPVHVHAPLDEEFTSIIEALGWKESNHKEVDLCRFG